MCSRMSAEEQFWTPWECWPKPKESSRVMNKLRLGNVCGIVQNYTLVTVNVSGIPYKTGALPTKMCKTEELGGGRESKFCKETGYRRVREYCVVHRDWCDDAVARCTLTKVGEGLRFFKTSKQSNIDEAGVVNRRYKFRDARIENLCCKALMLQSRKVSTRWFTKLNSLNLSWTAPFSRYQWASFQAVRYNNAASGQRV